MLEARTLCELVGRRAETTPDAVFLTDEEGRDMTFLEYRDAVEVAAAGLHAEHGVGEGTVVCWQLPTWIEAAVMVSALSRLGAVQNPLVPIYRERECGFIARQLRPSLVICPSTWRGFDHAAMHAGIAAASGLDFEILVADRTLPAGDPATLPPPPPPPGTPADAPVRWYFYTSGTTSDPKGARHTDVTVMHGGRVNAECIAMTVADTEVLVFPFTHIAGANILCSALFTGARLALVEAFRDPNDVADLVKREQVTIVAGATPIHQAFVTLDRSRKRENLFGTARIFPSGGAPIPPALHYELKQISDNDGIISGYGLTEAPLLTMNRVTDTDEQKAQTEGRPTTGVTLRIVTRDGDVAVPGTDTEGEIRAKGPQVMRGYVDASLDADGFDADGWFRTGDLGIEDADGYVRITGRLKDVIIRKGENISAVEVENVLYTHQRVAEVALIGLPDPATGERACAVVAAAPGTEPITFEEMQAHCRENGLMMQKIPEQLEVVDALPRNTAGKVMKQDLRARFGP
ncbi:MAG: AMP-binding protein [Acidimicrobiia bacterium]|nr:AMP-binding protein [Acidimicrobiia bacterium]